MHEDKPTSYPLAWPLGWPRSATHRRSPFKAAGLAAVAKEVYHELSLLGVGDWDVVISSNIELRRDGLPYSNQRKPDDPGVAVYFRMADAGRHTQPRVLACDRWETPEENLRAIAKHISAMRGMERWGVGTLEQAFSGYAALPAAPDVPHWSITLDVPPTASEAELRAAYAERVKRAHVDHGGNVNELQLVTQAWKAAKAARGIA